MNPRLRLTNRGDRTRRRASAERLAARGTLKPRAATAGRRRVVFGTAVS